MATKIKTRRRVDETFCACCLEKIPPKEGETKEEKAERERLNDQRTCVHRVERTDGKITKEEGEVPYYYNKKPYHEKCLIAYLQKKFKKNQDKIKEALADVYRRREKMIDEARTKGLLRSSEVQNAKLTRDGRERLINYLMGHYGTQLLSKKVQSTIKDLNDGKSVTYNKIVISYEKLLNMFMFFEKDLMKMYMSKVQKGTAPANANQRILYDLATVLNNLDEYDSTQEKKWYAQQDERVGGEIIDVRKYIRPTEDDTEAKVQKEIEMAMKFAEEQTKEYDEEDDSYIASLFKDD